MKINYRYCSKNFYLECNKKENKLITRYCCRACDRKSINLDKFLNNPKEVLADLINSRHGRVNELFIGKCYKLKNEDLCNEFVDYRNCSEITLGFPETCNFNCRYCPKFERTNDLEFDTKMLIAIFKALNNFPKIEELKLSDGGEITLFDLDLFLDNFPKTIKRLVIYTNGSNKNWIIKLQEYCKSNNISLIVVVSLHTLNRETFKYLSGVDKLDLVLNNILYWKELEINLLISHVNFKETALELNNFLNWINSNNLKISLDSNIYSDI